MTKISYQGSWLKVVDEIADERKQGLSIFKFGTHYKAFLEVMNLDYEIDGSYVATVRGATTIENACSDLLMRERILNMGEIASMEADWEFARYTWRQEHDAAIALLRKAPTRNKE